MSEIFDSCCRYRVYLGHKQYFVSSDVGYGKMQWYAFYNEPAGGTDSGGMLRNFSIDMYFASIDMFWISF